MANCAKYTKGAMGHMFKHYERGKDDSGKYVRFGNQQIDLSRTHLNYNLAPERNQLDFIQNRLKEVNVMKRKDVNVMCSWVVTAPKELPAEHHREFFERTYSFLRKRYSPDEKNIISAYVHMDEVTPHMHFAFIPVVLDAKKDREKVSAKEVINRTDLKTFHRDYQEEMERFADEHGNIFTCNVLNGATAGGNKAIEEYKAELLADLNQQENDRLSALMAQSGKEMLKLETAEERIKMLDESGRRLSKGLNSLKKDVAGLEADKSTLQGQIKALEGKIDALDSTSTALMQKFVEHPKIKPLFDEYCKAERKKIQERPEQRKSVRANLSRYQSEAKKQTQTSPERKHQHGRDER